MDDEMKLLLALDVQTTGLQALDDLAGSLERLQTMSALAAPALAALPGAAEAGFSQLDDVIAGRLAEARGLLTAFAADSGAAFAGVVADFTGMAGTIADGLGTLAHDVDQFGTTLQQGWDALWTDLGTTAGASLSALEQMTQGALAAIVGWFGDLATQVEAAALRAGQGLVSGMVAGLAGLAQALTDAISAAIASININVGPFHLSAAGFHIDPPSLPSISIPGFATGTASAPSGAALVGERGPELVTLPRGAQVAALSGDLGAGTPLVASRGGAGVVVNVSGNYLLAEHDLLELAERVGQALARQTGLAYYVNRG